MTAPMETCELTPEQKKKWDDTMSMMAWTAPGFMHLLLKQLVNHDGKHYCLPTTAFPNAAATDGRNIMVNPGPFFDYSLNERVFIVAHEVIHNVLDDPGFMHRCQASGSVPMHDGTVVPFRPDVMNRAMDYRINALLRDSRIGKVPDGCLLDDSIGTADTSVADIYRSLYEDEDGGSGRKEPGAPGFDQVMPPGTSTGQNPHTAAAQHNPQQWATEVATARRLEELRSAGDMPGALKRMFDAILNPKVPWQDYIRTLINKTTGSGGYDWSRADEDFIVHDRFEPAPTGRGAGWIVIWGDTSGSIADAEMNKYLREIGSILEDVRPTRVSVVWCDAAIHDVSEVTDMSDLYDIQSKGLSGGGGGTSVEPVFDWIKEQHEQPELFIGMTDGYVDFPSDAPHYPTIWASISKPGSVAYPFGEVVDIE